MKSFFKRHRKQIIGIAMMMVIMFVSSPKEVYADTTFKLTDFNKDSDTTKGTRGAMIDSTTLTITINSWWYGNSSVVSKGYSSCSFGKGNTNYTWEFKEHSISTEMNGLFCSATISNSPSVSISEMSNSNTYKCDDPYWSYHIKTTAKCWLAEYEQKTAVEYKIKSNGKSIATVNMLTIIKW